MTRGVKLDLTGQRFGRLKVLSRAERHITPAGTYIARWLCRCDCGTEVVVRQHSLRQGMSESCGCLQREDIAARSKIMNRTHGRTGTPEYRTWVHMKSRCYNPRVPEYKWYGARGIKMCESWKDSFEAFLADVGPKPGRGYSIDRIDNDGDYEPGNVRWATQAEQTANQQRNVKLTINGETQIMSEWARRYGLDVRLIHSRLKLGWSAYDAVTKPPRKITRKA